MAQAILIGSTIGNLACAARLSIKGHSVTVLEASNSWAPDLGQVSYEDFVFDVGRTFLTLPAIFRDLFLKTGSQIEDHMELVEDNISTRFHFQDGATLVLPGVGIGASAAAVAEAFGHQAGTEWKSFMAHAGRMWSSMRQSIIESTPPNLAQLLSHPTSVSQLRDLSIHKSYERFINGYFSDPHTVRLAQYFSTRVGSDPRSAPASLAIHPYLEQTFGIQHINGGVRRLADAIYQRCVSLGVAFHFSTTVTSVLRHNSQFDVSTSTGSHFTSEYVVIDSQSLDCSTMSVFDSLQSSSQLHPSHSEFVLLIALSGKTPGIEHHNVWFGESLNQEFGVINKSARAIAEDPDIYACVPNDRKMHPHDGEAWSIRVRASLHNPADGINWDNADIIAGASETVLATLARRGMDLRHRISWSEVRTPADFGRSSGNRTGALWGHAHRGRFSFLQRQPNVSTVPGLYILGVSAHPGPTLPFVAIGANIVAQEINS